MIRNPGRQYSVVLILAGLVTAVACVFEWAGACPHEDCGRNIWHLALAGLAGCTLTAAWYESRRSTSSIEDRPTRSPVRGWTSFLIAAVPLATMALGLSLQSPGGRQVPRWLKAIAMIVLMVGWVAFFVVMHRAKRQS